MALVLVLVLSSGLGLGLGLDTLCLGRGLKGFVSDIFRELMKFIYPAILQQRRHAPRSLRCTPIGTWSS